MSIYKVAAIEMIDLKSDNIKSIQLKGDTPAIIPKLSQISLLTLGTLIIIPARSKTTQSE
jgi:hypothetical protein